MSFPLTRVCLVVTLFPAATDVAFCFLLRPNAFNLQSVDWVDGSVVLIEAEEFDGGILSD